MEIGDVWWQLSTGKWILEHGSLPDTDPFSIGSAAITGGSFVLKGFWLSQITLYLVESISGLRGLIAFKSLLFTFTAFILWLAARRQGASSLMSSISVIPAVMVFTFYDEARAQTFTILFTAIALLLLEESRRPGLRMRFSDSGRDGSTAGRMPLLLAPLMLIWANMHPGFVVGIALILIYTFEHIYYSLVLKRSGIDKLLLISSSLAVALSSLNPNGLEAVTRTFYMLIGSASGSAPIHEHLGVAKFVELTGQRSLTIAFIVLGSMGALTFVLSRKRLDLLHLLIFSSLAGLSVITFRAGVFFALVSAQVLAYNFAGSETLNRTKWPNLSPEKGTKIHYALTILLAATGILILLIRSFFTQGLMSPGIFPEKAARFIEQTAAPANIYHPYEWGGYLMWRLYPKYKVFIDGRALIPISSYFKIQNTEHGWQQSLDNNDISTVVFWPMLPYVKRVPRIVFALAKNEQWRAVYWDTVSLVFVRSEFADKPIKRSTVWVLLESLARQEVELNPSDAGSYIALGEVYFNRELYTMALETFQKALSLAPGNSEAAQWVAIAGAKRTSNSH